MRDRHGTPFEHNAFRFHIRCPIFVAREWFRHRVGSFNEFCMRYAKATDDFYVPEPEDVRTQVGKPGAYSFEPVDAELAEATREQLREVYDTAYAPTSELVEQGVARELARAVLPVGAYTEFYWTVNARSLMNFLSLRAAETAQREIRRYAEACERFLDAADAGDVRGVRRQRPHGALARRQHHRVASRCPVAAGHDPAGERPRRYGAFSRTSSALVERHERPARDERACRRRV